MIFLNLNANFALANVIILMIVILSYISLIKKHYRIDLYFQIIIVNREVGNLEARKKKENFCQALLKTIIIKKNKLIRLKILIFRRFN
jgi:hypothetical protein